MRNTDESGLSVTTKLFGGIVMKTKHGIKILRNKGLYLGTFLSTLEVWELFWSLEIPEKN